MNDRFELLYTITSHYWARSVQLAARLRIADLISGGKTTLQELSAETEIDEWRLMRFLRVLAAIGIVRRSDDRYALTEKGRLLVAGTPGQVGDIARMNYYFFPAFTAIEDVLREGRPGYEVATGTPHFDAMQSMPEFAEAFDLAMNQIFTPETEAMVDAFDWSKFETLMDVGGGNGDTLLSILRATPGLKGHLFDLSHVVERAETRIAESGLAERVAATAGSFFEPLPGGAEAILLRHIVHDWQEEDILRILGRCRDALRPGGTLLIGESLIKDSDEITLPIRLDLAMMTFYNGAERTEQEYRELLGKCGFEVFAVTEITPALSILEARVS